RTDFFEELPYPRGMSGDRQEQHVPVSVLASLPLRESSPVPRQRIRIAVDGMKNSEDKFRVMVDTIPALVWCTLPDGSNEFHNQRWHDYTGLPEGEEHGWG